eukprot:scaffold7102_cov34-Attheya_sp.AAC.5
MTALVKVPASVGSFFDLYKNALSLLRFPVSMRRHNKLTISFVTLHEPCAISHRLPSLLTRLAQLATFNMPSSFKPPTQHAAPAPKEPPEPPVPAKQSTRLKARALHSACKQRDDALTTYNEARFQLLNNKLDKQLQANVQRTKNSYEFWCNQAAHLQKEYDALILRRHTTKQNETKNEELEDNPQDMSPDMSPDLLAASAPEAAKRPPELAPKRPPEPADYLEDPDPKRPPEPTKRPSEPEATEPIKRPYEPAKRPHEAAPNPPDIPGDSPPPPLRRVFTLTPALPKAARRYGDLLKDRDLSTPFANLRERMSSPASTPKTPETVPPIQHRKLDLPTMAHPVPPAHHEVPKEPIAAKLLKQTVSVDKQAVSVDKQAVSVDKQAVPVPILNQFTDAFDQEQDQCGMMFDLIMANTSMLSKEINRMTGTKGRVKPLFNPTRDQTPQPPKASSIPFLTLQVDEIKQMVTTLRASYTDMRQEVDKLTTEKTELSKSFDRPRDTAREKPKDGQADLIDSLMTIVERHEDQLASQDLSPARAQDGASAGYTHVRPPIPTDSTDSAVHSPSSKARADNPYSVKRKSKLTQLEERRKAMGSHQHRAPLSPPQADPQADPQAAPTVTIPTRHTTTCV